MSDHAPFPPAIYYKVVTNAPVIDLNAFAPRDYHLEARLQAGISSNSEDAPPKPSKAFLRMFYYRRDEAQTGGGWRLLEESQDVPAHLAVLREKDPRHERAKT